MNEAINALDEEINEWHEEKDFEKGFDNDDSN